MRRRFTICVTLNVYDFLVSDSGREVCLVATVVYIVFQLRACMYVVSQRTLRLSGRNRFNCWGICPRTRTSGRGAKSEEMEVCTSYQRTGIVF
jgi:hypothetical protein